MLLLIITVCLNIKSILIIILTITIILTNPIIMTRFASAWSVWWKEEEKLEESSPPSPASPWRSSS